MEEPATPWFVAEVTTASGLSPGSAWAIMVAGAVVVLVGGFLISVI